MLARMMCLGLFLWGCFGCAVHIQNSTDAPTRIVVLSDADPNDGAQPKRTYPRIHQTEDGIAIQGYDAVAYFLDGKARPGRPEHEAVWMGATWRFVNAEYQTLFINNPMKYAPQYGGYCSLGISVKIVDDGSPTAWAIVDDKLYLNYNKFYRFVWRIFPGSIGRANKNWPTVEALVQFDGDR